MLMVRNDVREIDRVVILIFNLIVLVFLLVSFFFIGEHLVVYDYAYFVIIALMGRIG